MNRRAVTALAMPIAGLAASSGADGSPDNGKVLARTRCDNCHDVDGHARSTSFQTVPIPVGPPTVSLVQEMRNSASGARFPSGARAPQLA